MKYNYKTLEEKKQLYEKHKNLIHKVLRDLHCNMKTKEQFDEYYSIAQFGLAKAINNISGDWKNATSTYFYAYIRNELINYFKYRSTPKRKLLGAKMADIYDFQNVIDAGIDLEKEYISKENNEELCKALDKLKPTHKDAIIRKYGMGMTIPQIAKEYHITPQAVQQRIAIALEKMRKELSFKLNE